VQEVKAVSISNRGLNPLSVRIQRNLVKNTVGKIPFGGQVSRPEMIMAWAGAGQFAVRWDVGLALDCDDGLCRSWLDCAVRKKERCSAGPVWLSVLGHTTNREGEERLSRLGFYPGFGPWPIEK
jgi:hypothetical protein